MQNLTDNFKGGDVSARKLASDENVSYQLTCKILQELRESGFVQSTMGPRGGYALLKPPSEISLADIVISIQGPLSFSYCLLGISNCKRKSFCGVHRELDRLGRYINEFLSGVTLDKLRELKNGDSHHSFNKIINFDLNKPGGKK